MNMITYRIAVVISFVILLTGCRADNKVDTTAPQSEVSTLLVGADKTVITPEVPETWTDVDGDYKYSPDKDTYLDKNGNGRFDAVWLAGFHEARPTMGIHDDLWARSVVIENNGVRIAIVALDLIGLFYDHVQEIRYEIPKELEIDYVIITSTHTHSGPDTIGIWGLSHEESGFDPVYLEFLKRQIVSSIIRATKRLKPAHLYVAMREGMTKDVISDSRPPVVIDDSLGILRFQAKDTDETIATIINWSNHPDALGSSFLKISSDYPHTLCSMVEEKLGGITSFINGSIGGQIEPTFPPDLPDAFHNQINTEPFLPAQLLGEYIGKLVLEIVKTEEMITGPIISIKSREIDIPLHNPYFKRASALRIVPRKTYNGNVRTEVGVVTIGQIQILCIPGEIYPEIVIGGVVTPSGADFVGEPLETPPLKYLMSGRYKFIFGLSNDEIGYIIPKTEWDEKPPFLYGLSSHLYGEVNSVGPDAAQIIHRGIANLLEVNNH